MLEQSCEDPNNTQVGDTANRFLKCYFMMNEGSFPLCLQPNSRPWSILEVEPLLQSGWEFRFSTPESTGQYCSQCKSLLRRDWSNSNPHFQDSSQAWMVSVCMSRSPTPCLLHHSQLSSTMGDVVTCENFPLSKTLQGSLSVIFCHSHHFIIFCRSC